MKPTTIQQHLEEFQLISCSLLPNERLTFLEGSESWGDALERYSTEPSSDFSMLDSPPTIGIRVDGANVWFTVTFRDEEISEVRGDHPRVSVSVKGEDISRHDQERWQMAVVEKLSEIGDSE